MNGVRRTLFAILLAGFAAVAVLAIANAFRTASASARQYEYEYEYEYEYPPPVSQPPGRGPGAVVQNPACIQHAVTPGDDDSSGRVPIGFPVDFFGQSYDSLFVNNNGNVTFGDALASYTPFDLTASGGHVIIAPFFADVDTRSALNGGTPVTYGSGAAVFEGHRAFCVNWVDVGYFRRHTDKLNSFQLLLVDRSDTGPGNFDIVLDYDGISWETGDASGGVDGFDGLSAHVGYSNGVDTALQLPGSGVPGSFLDSNTTTGLIANSRDSTSQPGRYLFQVRNGAPPVGGSISGHVTDSTHAGAPVAGAAVQACNTATGACGTRITNSAGFYSISGLASGSSQSYSLSAFPPAGSPLYVGHAGPVSLPAGANVTADVSLSGPQTLPSGSSISGPSLPAPAPHTTPVVEWVDTLTLTTTGCAGGTASYQLTAGGTTVRSGSMAESPAGSGHYTASIAPLFPTHGDAHVALTISCPGGGTTPVAFDLYIDPSGTVVDQNGDPVAGATVTLARSDTGDPGTFATVADGSTIMSPGNRSNPQVTGADGSFGWDAIAGFYVIEAAKAGCTTADSSVLDVPPPATDLVLALNCASSTTTSTTQSTSTQTTSTQSTSTQSTSTQTTTTQTSTTQATTTQSTSTQTQTTTTAPATTSASTTTTTSVTPSGGGGSHVETTVPRKLQKTTKLTLERTSKKALEAAHAGAAIDVVTVKFTVSAASTVVVEALDAHGKKLTLLERSKLGKVSAAKNGTSIKAAVKAGTQSVSLRLQRAKIHRGAKYRLQITATASGHSTKLTLPFSG